jgi:hypothetical protein
MEEIFSERERRDAPRALFAASHAPFPSSKARLGLGTTHEAKKRSRGRHFARARVVLAWSLGRIAHATTTTRFR